MDIARDENKNSFLLVQNFALFSSKYVIMLIKYHSHYANTAE